MAQSAVWSCANINSPAQREVACTQTLDSNGDKPRQAALLHLFRGYARLDLRKFSDAVDDFSAAATLDPSLWPAHAAKAEYSMQSRRYDDALADWDAVIAARPQLSIGYARRAETLDDVGRTQDALAAYGTAIDLAGKADSSGFLLFQRAVAYEGAHRYDEALTDMDEAIRRSPQNGLQYYGRGRLHALHGEYELAIQDLTKAFSLDHTNVYALLWLYIAEKHTGHGDALDQLRSRIAGTDTTVWPGPVARAILGQIIADDSVPATPAAWSEADRKAGAHCELSFFLGEQALLTGQQEKAATLFKAAVSTNLREYIEYRAAEYELARLKQR